MLIDSRIDTRGTFFSKWAENTVKNEPMFFGASLLWACANGGPITKEFIDNLPEDWRGMDVIVDSRVHMLMKGWFPCIPGYHHDDVPRSTENGQPNYLNPEYRSNHLMGLVNAEICPTEFALGRIELEIPKEGIIYKEWHKAVEASSLYRLKAESGVYIEFDDRSFHQGTRAVGNGWRWFIRLSKGTHRKPTNEIRRQVQVYLENPMEGW